MEKISQTLEDKLLDYLDGNLTIDEIHQLDDAMKRNASVKNRFDELRLLNNALLKTELEQPADDFTQRVISNLTHVPVTSRWSIRNAVFLFLGVVTFATVALVLLSAGVFDDATATFTLKPTPVSWLFIPAQLSSLTINIKMIVNSIILMNIVLAWIILDRTILRPYFQHRMKEG